MTTSVVSFPPTYTWIIGVWLLLCENWEYVITTAWRPAATEETPLLFITAVLLPIRPTSSGPRLPGNEHLPHAWSAAGCICGDRSLQLPESSAEVKGVESVLTGPFKYDKKDNTYYVEISWDGYTIANSGKKYQLAVGMYHGDVWKPENDWSYQTMKIGKEGDFAAVDNPPEVLNENMCVYVDGVLVGGTEPDGSTPDTESKTDDKEITVTETPNTDIVYGDANLDGKASISDAVAILQSIANADKYSLEPQGKINADVDGVEGVTGKDAAVIQLYDAGIVKTPRKG